MSLPDAIETATAELLERFGPAPTGGAWIAAARAAATQRVTTLGAPRKRDEYWRYTDPTPLLSGAGPAASDTAPDYLFEDVDAVQLVFVDGVFDADASDPLALEGAEIMTLSEAAATDLHWAKDLYGALETQGQTPVPRPLAALNTACAEQGLLIRAVAETARPIRVVYRQADPAATAMLHVLVRVEEGASLTLIEDGQPAAQTNTCLEVDVANGAAFHHLRHQGRAHERTLATHLFARLGDNSVFKSFTLTSQGRLTRNEAVMELTGDDAVAHVAGTVLGDGSDVHHDDTVFVTHDAERCESRQVFKKVLRNGATGVFQGKILVKEGAQKTDGYQISQSLLLDEDAQFLAKPELEIYADDVACSHGSTSGAIDEDALFYLRSRGVPLDQSHSLLVLAFLAEAIDEIEDEALAEAVLSGLRAQLGIDV